MKKIYCFYAYHRRFKQTRRVLVHARDLLQAESKALNELARRMRRASAPDDDMWKLTRDKQREENIQNTVSEPGTDIVRFAGIMPGDCPRG